MLIMPTEVREESQQIVEVQMVAELTREEEIIADERIADEATENEAIENEAIVEEQPQPTQLPSDAQKAAEPRPTDSAPAEPQYYEIVSKETEYSAKNTDLKTNTTPQPVKPSKNTKEKKFIINNDLTHVFSNNIEMTPFKKQNVDVKWVRISLNESICFPVAYQKLFASPFVVSSFKRYKHLILGLSVEDAVQSYILGVPSKYDADYAGIALKLGFTQFKCCEDIKPQNGEYGYWIRVMVL